MRGVPVAIHLLNEGIRRSQDHRGAKDHDAKDGQVTCRRQLLALFTAALWMCALPSTSAIHAQPFAWGIAPEPVTKQVTSEEKRETPPVPSLEEMGPTPARYTSADTEVAIASLATARTRCIVLHEVPSKDPYAIGRAGEQGIAQLHPRGLLPDFYRQGFGDPFSPYESVQYVNGALDRGLAPHWSVVTNGSC